MCEVRLVFVEELQSYRIEAAGYQGIVMVLAQKIDDQQAQSTAERALAARLGVIIRTHWGYEISETHLAMVRRMINA